MKINKSLSIILMFLILGFYTYIFVAIRIKSISIFGFEKDAIDIRMTIIRSSLLSFFSLLGILSKVLYDELEKAESKDFKFLTTLQKTVNSKYFWMAVLTCPVVIAGFYKSIEIIDSLLLISLLAYQNGFFFKSIIGKGEIKSSKNETEE